MRPSRSRLLVGAFFSLGLALLWVGHDPAAGEPKKGEPKALELPPVFSREQPESVEDLKAIEAHVEALLPKIMPAVVGVRIGASSGSGVIVDKDGHILTAGHVSGKPDTDATIILPDDTKLKAKTLGRNGGIDSGMIELKDKKDYPFVRMGKSSELKKGQWVLAIGHPGGFRPNRTPVVRVGRILFVSPFVIRTDCTLVGGDSGGPLFDMQGRVIGIHSRIGGSISENIHVPVDAYHKDWARLAKGESFGGQLGQVATVQSAGGRIIFEKDGAITAKDPRDKKQANSFAQTHVVKMMPGFAYTIEMGSTDGKKLDPLLRLEDADGKQLDEDDDGAGFPNARIVFRPTRAGEYRIVATTFEANQTGPYKLVVQQAELLAGKVSVIPAMAANRAVVLNILDQASKKGVPIFAAVLVYDAKGNAAAAKGLHFLWDKGEAKVKSDDHGMLRLPLTRKNIKDLVLDVPDGMKVALVLTDGAGNVFGVKSDFDKATVKSGGGKLVLQEESQLTESEPLDTVRAKSCRFKAHAFRMAPGSIYTIDLESRDFDAFLRLEDPSGKQLAEDDDGAGRLNSRIVFTPETEGVYRLIVTTCDPNQDGNYRLSIYQAPGKKDVDGKATPNP